MIQQDNEARRGQVLLWGAQPALQYSMQYSTLQPGSMFLAQYPAQNVLQPQYPAQNVLQPQYPAQNVLQPQYPAQNALHAPAQTQNVWQAQYPPGVQHPAADMLQAQYQVQHALQAQYQAQSVLQAQALQAQALQAPQAQYPLGIQHPAADMLQAQNQAQQALQAQYQAQNVPQITHPAQPVTPAQFAAQSVNRAQYPAQNVQQEQGHKAQPYQVRNLAKKARTTSFKNGRKVSLAETLRQLRASRAGRERSVDSPVPGFVPKKVVGYTRPPRKETANLASLSENQELEIKQVGNNPQGEPSLQSQQKQQILDWAERSLKSCENAMYTRWQDWFMDQLEIKWNELFQDSDPLETTKANISEAITIYNIGCQLAVEELVGSLYRIAHSEGSEINKDDDQVEPSTARKGKQKAKRRRNKDYPKRLRSLISRVSTEFETFQHSIDHHIAELGCCGSISQQMSRDIDDAWSKISSDILPTYHGHGTTIPRLTWPKAFAKKHMDEDSIEGETPVLLDAETSADR